jgi:hypothetical protein
MRLWCGIDWAENHHDISVVDENGSQQVRLQIEDTAAGFGQLMSLLAEQNLVSDEPVTVAIETAKGLLPAALRGGRCHAGRGQPAGGVSLPGPAFAQSG